MDVRHSGLRCWGAPFRVWPTPPWFVTNRAAAKLGPKLAGFEAAPSAPKALGIFAAAVRG